MELLYIVPEKIAKALISIYPMVTINGANYMEIIPKKVIRAGCCIIIKNAIVQLFTMKITQYHYILYYIILMTDVLLVTN